MSEPAEQDIRQLLERLGFANDEDRRAARVVLEAAGVTRSSKSRISGPNARRAEEVLASAFARSCGHRACLAAVAAARPDARLLISADRSQCEYCGGKDNQRAANEFLAACRGRNVAKLVIVGGSPVTRDHLDLLFAGRLNTRYVDGTGRRTKDQAHADVLWADLVLVLGATELAHRMSDLYTRVELSLRWKVLQTPRTGIASILNFAAEHLRAGTGRKGQH